MYPEFIYDVQTYYLNPCDRPYAFKLTVHTAGKPEKER
jgi:hypothetical protein